MEIGPYKIESILGKGGMGVVYKGRHSVTGRQCAIKTITVAHREMVKGIRREVRALACIRHPGIVRIFDEGIHHNLPWYAMEFIEGSSFRALLETYQRQDYQRLKDQRGTQSHRRRKDPISTSAKTDALSLSDSKSIPRHSATLKIGEVQECSSTDQNNDTMVLTGKTISKTVTLSGFLKSLSILGRLCYALSALHGQGIVHRDLKPENIIMTNSGVPILVDFGIVTHFSCQVSRETLDIDQNIVGTANYIAPEQIRGDLVDGRADLYSLGCILYEAVTGRPPFQGKTVEQLLSAHLEQEPLPPSKVKRGLPLELDVLILNLLAKKPRHRMGYADSVAAKLRKFGDGFEPDEQEVRSLPYLYRPRFVGRETSLKVVSERLNALSEGSGSMIFIGGESGVGKTRFALECARLAIKKGVLVLSGESYDNSSRPLEPFRKPLQELVDHCREKGLNETEHLFGQRGQVLSLYHAPIHELPGQADYPEPVELPLPLAHKRLFRYLGETFGRLSSSQPVLLLLDDLQWSDGLSLEFLFYLTSSEYFEKTPLIVMGLYRIEEMNEELKELCNINALSLNLERLDLTSIDLIVQDMLALQKKSELFVEHLCQHSEGNPFFVAEYLRAAVDAGLLQRDREGNWHIIEPGQTFATLEDYDNLTLPHSLQELISRRLSGLSALAWITLKSAAILGRESRLDLLSKMTGMDEEVLLDILTELQLRHIADLDAKENIRFVHDKIRECSQALLTDEELCSLHKKAAKAIEKITPEDSIENFSDQLGLHWEGAGELEKAREYFLRAARFAREQYDFSRAHQLFLSYFKLTSEPTQKSIKIRNEHAQHVLAVLGRIDEAIQVCERALYEAKQINDLHAEAHNLYSIGSNYYKIGKLDQAQHYFDMSLEIVEKIGEDRFKGAILSMMGSYYQNKGESKKAARLFGEALELNRSIQYRRGEAVALNNLANLENEHGEVEKSLCHYQEARVITQNIAERRFEAIILCNMANLYGERGLLSMADKYYIQALRIIREHGDRQYEGSILCNYADNLREMGSIDDAQHFNEQALHILKSIGDMRFMAISMCSLGDVYHQQGKIREARDILEEALLLTRETGDRRHEGIAFLHLAALEFDQGNSAAAREKVVQAVNILGHIEDPPKQCISLIQQAQIERICFSNFTYAQALIDRAHDLISAKDYPLVYVTIVCEQGHLRLAQDHHAAEQLKRINEIMEPLDFLPASSFRINLNILRESNQFHLDNQKHLLFRGTYKKHIPPLLVKKAQ